MQVARIEGTPYRRSLRPLPLTIALALLAACSSSSPPPEESGQTGFVSSPTAGRTGTQPSNGGMAMVDAGTMDAGPRNMTSSGSQGGAAASARAGGGGSSGADAAGRGGAPSTMDGGVTGAGTGGSAGKAGAGGRAGIGGSQAGSNGAQAGMGADEDAGACVPLEEPLMTSFGKCSMDICPAQDSVCVPTNLLTSLGIAEKSIELLANCNDTYKCVPETLANRGGRVLLTRCKSINDAEGRCLSTCVPQVALQASQLPKDICQGTDLCAPCFDPRTGEETGACDQGCDTGPSEPPKLFRKCCSDRGLCVPPALAAEQAKNLNRESCSEETLCAPKELADPTFRAKPCDSIDGAEGRCISTCVGGAVAKQKDRLPTAGCAAEEVCAPCFDPITGEDTGACKVNGDMPQKPAQTFARCCGESNGQPVGVCVSPELAGGQAMALRQEMCAEGKLCAPIAKASDPAFEFRTCNSLLGAGVCVNACIPDPTQAALLSRAGCAQGELCAPCNLLGSPTGACL